MIFDNFVRNVLPTLSKVRLSGVSSVVITDAVMDCLALQNSDTLFESHTPKSTLNISYHIDAVHME
ncbi:MAG TPA: hypothetical protein VE616_03130 [Candidatus Udaeobacter sp.]|nr:hypothetical protein [Candidatus Udaeobacter sp.]